jgi:hypothetical protein
MRRDQTIGFLVVNDQRLPKAPRSLVLKTKRGL